jgi:hypothetical protein
MSKERENLICNLRDKAEELTNKINNFYLEDLENIAHLNDKELLENIEGLELLIKSLTKKK